MKVEKEKLQKCEIPCNDMKLIPNFKKIHCFKSY